MTRPTWDQTWLNVATVVAQRSLCVRDQVGAVIVDPRNRIVATGFNGPPSGFVHNGQPCAHWCKRVMMAQMSEKHGLALDYSDCPSSHAESNALSVCDRSVREGGIIYVTSQVCFGCAKMIANSGLSQVVIRETPKRDYRDPDKSYDFLEKCGITVVTVESR